jgi:hypothetical protein
MSRAAHGLLIVGIVAAVALGVAASLRPTSEVREPEPERETEPPAALPYFGFNEAAWGTAWQGQALNDAIATAAQAGANTNRLTVRWFDVIGPSGGWDEDGWARYRTAYQTMLLAGIQPIVMLVAAPRGTDQLGDPNWAAPGCLAGGASPPAPEYDQQWKDFVTRAGFEFPNALAFQIWNEPNSEEYWGGCDVDPARYVQLVDLARQALGPPRRMPIVSAGLNSAVDEPAGVSWTGYLQQALYAGLLADDRAQFLGVHPYPRPGTCGSTGARTARALVDAMRLQVEEAERLSPARVWVTEFGVTSAVDLPAECRALGPTAQAQVLTAMYDLLARSDSVEVGIVHQLVDQAITNADPNVVTYWSNFGVTKNSTALSAFLEPKDAYWCLAGRRGRPNRSTVPCALGESAG